jgi:hypothetical protein
MNWTQLTFDILSIVSRLHFIEYNISLDNVEPKKFKIEGRAQTTDKQRGGGVDMDE